MAVASDHSLLRPEPFFGSCGSGSSAKLSSLMKGEPTNDSDDDYGYVASLAEQIAHAMLDDDDECHEDAFVRGGDGFVSCSPFRQNAGSKLDIQVATHNSWFRTSKVSGKISEARASINSSSTPLFVPSYRHDFTYFARSQAERTVGCESTIPAGEYARETSGGQPVDWHLLPYLARTSQLAVVPLSASSPAGVESSSTPVAMPTSETVANYASPKVSDDKPSQMRDCRGNLHRDRLPASGRNRHRRHQVGTDGGGGRRQGVCHYCGQGSPLTSWHTEDGAGTVLLGYGNGRKETAGTGVFLPRMMATGSHNRKKSASKTAHAQEERKL